MQDDEVEKRLLEVLANMRPTSKFALETFVRAVESKGVIGAELTLKYVERQGHVECEVVVRAPD